MLEGYGHNENDDYLQDDDYILELAEIAYLRDDDYIPDWADIEELADYED